VPTYYVRSTDGNDADSGLTWALAKATIVGAAAVMAAGERCWISQAHAETQAAGMTITSPGTAAAPCEFLCGNDAAEPPTALATTATIATSGANTISLVGYAYTYGVTFLPGSTTNAADFRIVISELDQWVLDTCGVTLDAGSSSRMRIGHGSGAVALPGLICLNCTVVFGNTSQGIVTRGAVARFQGGSIALTGTVPTTLFLRSAGPPNLLKVRGVNLSAFGSGTALVNVGDAAPGLATIEHCRLGSGVALVTGTPPSPNGYVVQMDNCDSADTNYRMQRHQYEGNSYSETTLIRTGGASDGTTGLSHKHVSSANSKFYAPLYGPEMVVWNDAVGASQTVTCEILHDSLTALTDAEVWLETEYLGTTGFPLSLFASDRAASIIAAPANQAASSETWTTTGMTNPNKQKLVTTQTPQEKGYYRCRVAVAKASYTVYADPKLAVA